MSQTIAQAPLIRFLRNSGSKPYIYMYHSTYGLFFERKELDLNLVSKACPYNVVNVTYS